MQGLRLSRKDFEKIIAMHKRYLETYQLFNRGSLKGATSFNEFYIYWTFKTKYSDMRLFALVAYR